MFPTRRNSNLVVVEEKVEVEGDYGPSTTWEEFKKVWVSIVPNRTKEIHRGDERIATVTHTVRGDYLELQGITDEMRLVFNEEHDYDPINADSEVFDVIAPMPDYDSKSDIMIQVDLNNLRYGPLGDNRAQ